jgi:copper transport protein
MIAVRRLVPAVAGTVTVVAVLLVCAGPAAAHAELASSEPPQDAVLEVAPTQVVLRFTEGVDTVPDGIRVISADGTELVVGPAGHLGSDNAAVGAELPAAANGVYVVSWRVVSTDGHPIAGAFSYQVGEVAAVDPAAVAALLSQVSDTGSADLLLTVGRFASYLGIAIAVGTLTLAASIVEPSRRLRNLAWWALGAGIAGTVAMVAGQAAAAVGRGIGAAFDAGGWEAVLESRAGSWWAARAAILVAAVLLVTTLDKAHSTVWRVSASMTGLVLLWAVAAGGHAVTGRAVAVGFGATIVHLAAMSVWLGGLVALLATFPGQPAGHSLALARRFSPVALVAMVAVVASGLANALRQVDSPGELASTPYGRWLLVKTGLVVATIVLAAGARRLVRGGVLGPVRAVPLPVGAAVAEHTPTDRARLRRTLGTEVALGVAILAVTAALVDASPPASASQSSQLPPAATAEPVPTTAVPSGTEAPADAPATTTRDGRVAVVVLDPPVAGEAVAVHVNIDEADAGDPAPDEMRVQASLPERGIGPIDVAVEPFAPGQVVGRDVILPVAGSWLFEVVARYGEFEQTIIPVTVEVS